MSDVADSEAPEAYGRAHGSGFWVVAFAFLVVMAVATLPSPLYGLYRTCDHLSPLTITVVFAIFAGSTIGPLIAGCLAQWVAQPLTVPYLVFVALGVVALAGLWTAPETGAPAPPAARRDQLAGSKRRTVRLPVPAAAATLAAFAANGLFAALSGLILATTMHQPSHALSGVALFLVFAAGVVSQLATTRLQASRVLELGTISMLAGLVLLATSVRLSAPSLALFLIAGALIGAGSGAVFKATQRTQHRARLRHPCWPGRRRLGLGTAGTPTLIPRPDLSTTGRRDDMSSYFTSVRVQAVAS